MRRTAGTITWKTRIHQQRWQYTRTERLGYTNIYRKLVVSERKIIINAYGRGNTIIFCAQSSRPCDGFSSRVVYNKFRKYVTPLSSLSQRTNINRKKWLMRKQCVVYVGYSHALLDIHAQIRHTTKNQQIYNYFWHTRTILEQIWYPELPVWSMALAYR